jgi:hypothetical protein
VARSTPIVLSAGVVTLGHGLLVDKREPADLLKTVVAIGLAAVVSAGLDAAAPGLGTGAAVLLLTVAVLTLGPDLITTLAKAVK